MRKKHIKTKTYFFQNIVRTVLLFLFVMNSYGVSIGQTVVGMGTETPNPNAVLELVSESHNQGLLVPRLTTVQRTADTFTSRLSEADNGLLIFDVDAGSFFFWFNGEWWKGLTQGTAYDTITKTEINANVAGSGLGKNADDGSLEINISGGGLQITEDKLELKNKGDAQLLIGDGTKVNVQNLSGDISLANNGNTTVVGLQGQAVGNNTPANGQVLTWDGAKWIPQTPRGTMVWYYGYGPPPDSTTVTAATGDMYFNKIENAVYVYDGASWSSKGTLLPGGTYEAATRSIGDVLVWDGNKWVSQSSSPGGTGAIWYSGAQVPDTAYPVGAGEGDFYYKTDTQAVYRMESGNWVQLGRWINANAPATIVPGNTIDPTNSQGNIGDFYIKSNGDAWIKVMVNKWVRFQ